MKYAVWLLLISLFGCAQKPVVTVVDKPFDTASAWTTADADQVAKAMTADMLGFPWLAGFQQRTNGESPVLQVGQLDDQTNEQLAMEYFREALNQQLLAAKSVKAVAGEHGEADFVLSGRINVQIEQTEVQRTARYQVTLNLIEKLTQRQVWFGEYMIEKKQRKTPVQPRS